MRPCSFGAEIGFMIIEETIDIGAPLSVVWDVFSSLENWEEWNSVCRSCSLIEGESLARGVCFSFTLRPYLLPVRVTPRVTRCEPGREVVWEGARLGVRARHCFTFHEREDGVRLRSVEEFAGAILWLGRLLLVPRRLHRLSRQFLQEIKSHSERCAATRAACRDSDSRVG